MQDGHIATGGLYRRLKPLQQFPQGPRQDQSPDPTRYSANTRKIHIQREQLDRKQADEPSCEVNCPGSHSSCLQGQESHQELVTPPFAQATLKSDSLDGETRLWGTPSPEVHARALHSSQRNSRFLRQTGTKPAPSADGDIVWYLRLLSAPGQEKLLPFCVDLGCR